MSNRVRAWLLLCASIPGSIASANRFSNGVVRQLLLCVSITIDPVSAFVLACQPISVLVENAGDGVDAYETPRRGRIKGAKNECECFPLTLT